MDISPLCIDILENIVHHLEDAELRRLRLVCKSSQQAVDRYGVQRVSLSIWGNAHKFAKEGSSLCCRFPSIKHLALDLSAYFGAEDLAAWHQVMRVSTSICHVQSIGKKRALAMKLEDWAHRHVNVLSTVQS